MEQYAKQIIQTLRENGYEAYMVGGYVRDKCLGRTVKDIDIATSALPDHVQNLFPRTIPTGIQHGTVTVLMDKYTYEVTTFRKESDYSDHRRPTNVQFVPDLLEDLKRRDFTMNAMAMDEHGQLIDPYGGLTDAKNGVIRCVGEATERFTEDALRMLRCIRFAAEYKLKIQTDTWEAIRNLCHTLKHIAMERVRAELERIITGADPYRGLRLFVESGLYACLKVNQAGLTEANWKGSLQYVPLANVTKIRDPIQRWALWLIALDCNEKTGKQFLRDLTCSGKWIRQISRLLAWKEAMKLIQGEQDWKLAVLQFNAASAASWITLMEQCGIGAEENYNTEVMQHAYTWLEEMPVKEVKELAITGHDLLPLPGVQGPLIRHVLQVLLQEVALGRVNNEKEALLNYAKAVSKDWSVQA